MTNNLGKVLQGRRKSKELTLRQASISSGVSVAHIGRIERGERFPSARILRKLANPLDFSEVELLKLAGFMSQDGSKCPSCRTPGYRVLPWQPPEYFDPLMIKVECLRCGVESYKAPAPLAEGEG